MEHSTWHRLLKEELPNHYFSKINQFMDKVYEEGTIYPPRDKVFNALLETPFEEVRVVILGQDPYHGPNQAQGLSFSVPETIPAPPSLVNILKELGEDLGPRSHHVTINTSLFLKILKIFLLLLKFPHRSITRRIYRHSRINLR